MARSLSALIADPSSGTRLSVRNVLQELGVGRIDTASGVAEARRRLLESRYDIVLCEYHFDSEETGQDLLEEMRERKAMPISTIFVMVTGEASYARVIGVAEETPDDYMLKPVQTGELSDRIQRAFTRREALIDIYEALNANDFNRALKEAQQIMQQKTPYLADVVRIAANTLYRLGRFAESARMYQRILETRNPAWAKLGLAKVALRQGDHATAEKAMLDIVGQHLQYLPVYTQLADLYVSDERYADALDITEQAIKITPHSVRRLQQAGQIAYSLGNKELANDYLGRAVRFGGGRPADLDYRSIFYILLMQFDSGHSSDAASLVKQIAAKQKAGADEGRRGAWYGELAVATEAIARREPLAAVDILRKLAGHCDAPEFDFALALDYVTVIDRLYAEDIGATLAEWVQPMAYRFASSRHAQELLGQRVASRTRLTELINRAADEIAQIAEQAASLMVEGSARGAAELLAQGGFKHHNNRLLASAANAAARAFQATGEAQDRQQAEACLAAMNPPDEALRIRIRGLLDQQQG
ncbi:response regulator [Chitinimonas sp.]|uniref:response regulator n=1 Tax=Chitinimonas sp. TaxID=1934313 RepID=UPI0035B430EF